MEKVSRVHFFSDNPVELFVCEFDNNAAWKTYELRLRRIDMIIFRKSVFTHKSIAKTNKIMDGIL